MPRPSTEVHRQFPETSWGLILRAKNEAESDRRAALAELCEVYWPPLYAFARYRGKTPHQAEDLTQGFLAHLLRTEGLERVDESKGKLRSFLLASFKQFMAKEHAHESRQKRGGEAEVISIDQEIGENYFLAIPSGDLGPDALFDKQWLAATLDQVLQKLRTKFVKADKENQFEVLKRSLDQTADFNYAEASSELGMSDGGLRVAVHRLRRDYGELVREEISQTLARWDEREVEAEIQYLVSLA